MKRSFICCSEKHTRAPKTFSPTMNSSDTGFTAGPPSSLRILLLNWSRCCLLSLMPSVNHKQIQEMRINFRHTQKNTSGVKDEKGTIQVNFRECFCTFCCYRCDVHCCLSVQEKCNKNRMSKKKKKIRMLLHTVFFAA